MKLDAFSDNQELSKTVLKLKDNQMINDKNQSMQQTSITYLIGSLEEINNNHC